MKPLLNTQAVITANAYMATFLKRENKTNKPTTKKKENKPGDLFTLKTFKTDPNLNVHPDMSHVSKSETKIFFKKGNKGLKSTIPQGILVDPEYR